MNTGLKKKKKFSKHKIHTCPLKKECTLLLHYPSDLLERLHSGVDVVYVASYRDTAMIY